MDRDAAAAAAGAGAWSFVGLGMAEEVAAGVRACGRAGAGAWTRLRTFAAAGARARIQGGSWRLVARDGLLLPLPREGSYGTFQKEGIGGLGEMPRTGALWGLVGDLTCAIPITCQANHIARP